jgi:hypothetical protein
VLQETRTGCAPLPGGHILDGHGLIGTTYCAYQDEAQYGHIRLITMGTRLLHERSPLRRGRIVCRPSKANLSDSISPGSNAFTEDHYTMILRNFRVQVSYLRELSRCIFVYF